MLLILSIHELRSSSDPDDVAVGERHERAPKKASQRSNSVGVPKQVLHARLKDGILVHRSGACLNAHLKACLRCTAGILHVCINIAGVGSDG